MGCSENNTVPSATGGHESGTPQTGEPDYKKIYSDANDAFERRENVEYDVRCNIRLSTSELAIDALLTSRIIENNKNTENYQMSDSSVLKIGNGGVTTSDVVYTDGIFYQKNGEQKVAYEMSCEEFVSYMNDGNPEDITAENSYGTFTGGQTALGTQIQYSDCDKESFFLKNEVVAALILCGFGVSAEDVAIKESDGTMVVDAGNDIVKESRIIKADFVMSSETISVEMQMDLNVIDSDAGVIAAPDISEYKMLPDPYFSQELADLYGTLVEKKGFELRTENEVKFVVNNTSATFTDENTIEYVNDEELSFDIDYEQTIKCSKLSPKTTTNTVTENFSTKTGKYVAYENKTKVSDVEANADDATGYIYQQLMYLVPDYMLFDSISSSTSEDGTVTSYTFNLSEDYINAYCAYYITYYDSSLAAYPYDSTVIEAAEGEIVIIADAAQGVIRDVMISMSCKYNYQSKYTISFTYSGSAGCEVRAE